MLEVKNWSAYNPELGREILKQVNFNVKKGEIVGFAGLMGSGRTELALSLFGNPDGFRINGERLFVKGSNWVPADAFHSRDAGRYERMLGLFADLECNILRCWGGNVYEDHRLSLGRYPRRRLANEFEHIAEVALPPSSAQPFLMLGGPRLENERDAGKMGPARRERTSQQFGLVGDVGLASVVANREPGVALRRR